MRRARWSARGPVLVLAGAGLLLLLAGAAGMVAGLTLAGRIQGLLPPEVTIDRAAVGGAALALGAAVVLGGAVHLVTAFGVSRGRALVAGIVLAAVMAVMAVGWAATALVSAAAGTAPPMAMLPAGIGLLGVAAAYAWTALALARARAADRPAT